MSSQSTCSALSGRRTICLQSSRWDPGLARASGSPVPHDQATRSTGARIHRHHREPRRRDPPAAWRFGDPRLRFGQARRVPKSLPIVASRGSAIRRIRRAPAAPTRSRQTASAERRPVRRAAMVASRDVAGRFVVATTVRGSCWGPGERVQLAVLAPATAARRRRRARRGSSNAKTRSTRAVILAPVGIEPLPTHRGTTE